MARPTQPHRTKPCNDTTVERVREMLDYDPETGILRWKVSPGGGWAAGSVAGSIKQHGKTQKVHIGLDGFRYQAHRLAWLWMTGEWPRDLIDHIDTNGTNNRWANLREANQSQNLCNRGVNRNNATGLKGVHIAKKTGRYAAHIRIEGRSLHLGMFSTPQEAHEAYKQAAIRFYGEFARWD